VIKEVVREVPREQFKTVELLKEVAVETVREVPKEVVREVVREVRVEVPVEVIRNVEVEVPVELIREVPVEVQREVPLPHPKGHAKGGAVERDIIERSDDMDLIRVMPAAPGSLPRPSALSASIQSDTWAGYDTGPVSARSGSGRARLGRGSINGSRTGTTGFGASGSLSKAGSKLDGSVGYRTAETKADAGRAPLTGHNVWSRGGAR